MDERRDGPANTRSIYDRLPAWQWVDALAWLGELQCLAFKEEACRDNAAFLAANPCDEFWRIGHDFDTAVTTLVVDSVRSDPDGVRMARIYMDGLRPPAWSRCAGFLEAGIAAGGFHDIEVEADPWAGVSVQRLVDDIPVNPGDKWGEIPEGLDGCGGLDDPLRIEAARWLDGLGTPRSVGDAIRYMEVNPHGHLWALGWEFDRALLHHLAGELAFCEEPYWLSKLSAALCIPDGAKDASLVERLLVGRVRFLDARGFEWDILEGPPEDPGDAAGPNRASFERGPSREYRETRPSWLTWAEGLWDAGDADGMIRHLQLEAPGRSWWDIEGFDPTVANTLRFQGVGAAASGKLGRLLELLDPPQESETRRWLTGLIGERRRARMLRLAVAVLVLIALWIAVRSLVVRPAQDERAQQIQEDLEEMQLHREGSDAASDDEDGPGFDPGAQDAVDRLYDMLDV